MKILTLFVALVVSFVVISTTFILADTEAISHRSFSLYDYIGGLWQLNQNIYHTTATDNKDVGDSIASRLGDAMTPDFIATCTIEGRPGFPSAKSRFYGLPPDLDIGTGASRVVACALQVNDKAWKDKSNVVSEYLKDTGNNNNVTESSSSPTSAKISSPLVPKTVGMKLPPNPTSPGSAVVSSQIFFVPSSMNSAVVYQVTPFEKIKSKKEREFYQKKYKMQQPKQQKKLQEGAPDIVGEEAGEVEPIFVVTHKGKLDVKHQFKMLNAVDAKELSSIMSSLPVRAKHGFAHANSVLAPVYIKKDSESDVEEDEECSMQVTRVSAVFTTKTDILLNIAVKYTGGELCFGEQQEEQEEVEGNDKKKTSSSSTSSSVKSRASREASEIFLLNTKRFATVNDEEMLLDPDTPWYMKSKFGPSIGAFVLLFVIIGGRKAVTWYLRRRGVDVDQFLKSTKQKTKEDIIRMRKQRMAMKGGPMTDEEVARLQVLEQEEELKKRK